jgi:hypothetical protein
MFAIQIAASAERQHEIVAAPRRGASGRSPEQLAAEY